MDPTVIVHGMRMPPLGEDGLHKAWYPPLIAGLRETDLGRKHPGRLPGPRNVITPWWGDIPRRAQTGVEKGARHLRAYYALLRGVVRAADIASLWNEIGEPIGPIAGLVHHIVRETTLYMSNAPVPNADPKFAGGAYFQIQGRVHAGFKHSPKLVIGHSLGSVIAYEALLCHEHKVDTFITVGSPMATPDLIREPLQARVNRMLQLPADTPLPWPGVRRWINFTAPADVWVTPVPKLAPTIHPDIEDVVVEHGDPRHFVRTHMLTSYLKHPELCDAIADALER